MSRLVATFGVDVRMQSRNGFYLAAGVIVVFSIVLLRWLQAETAELLLPIVLLQNVLVNSFYFVSGLVLLERGEGSIVAQAVTPLRPGEYLGAKVATLAALSLAESLLIVAFTRGPGPSLGWVAIGVVLASVLFTLAGVRLVVHHASINEFLMPSVVYTALLSLPILGLLGVGRPSWYTMHPLQGPTRLMMSPAPGNPVELAWSIGYAVLWMVPAWIIARRALARLTHS